MGTHHSIIAMRQAHENATGDKWCYLCMKWKKVATAFTKGLRNCDGCQGKRKKGVRIK